MTTTDQHKPGEKPRKRKPKKAGKAEPRAAAAPAANEPTEAAMTPKASFEHTPAIAAAPAEPARPEPVQRVASFSERMASVAPAVGTTTSQSPAREQPPAPSPTAAPVAGIQAIANAYRDYTRTSLEHAQSFAEKLTSARSLDKAVEAQTEFARQACETFADNARKIRALHRELFWQAFRLPNWPPGGTPR